jgi:hypothetical protein
MPFVLRFFFVVRVTHPLTGVAFAAALATAGVALTMDSSNSGALAPLLLLQALATSSGFTGAARRGHYDLLFATGQSRIAIALTHWAMSALPGVVIWACIAALESVLRRGAPHLTFASGTIVVMLLVSTLPWALTVPLPRLTGGISLILLAAITSSVMPGAGSTLVRPWALAGRQITGNEIVPVALVLTVAGAAMAVALTWVARADVPLETAQ